MFEAFKKFINFCNFNQLQLNISKLVEMDEQIDCYLDRCRCCLEDITLAKVEIDNIIEMKFFEMTQLNVSIN